MAARVSGLRCIIGKSAQARNWNAMAVYAESQRETTVVSLYVFERIRATHTIPRRYRRSYGSAKYRLVGLLGSLSEETC